MKFKPGDRIIDNSPQFGKGTIIRIDEYRILAYNDEPYYDVLYDGSISITTGCPESEMRKLTKLDKILE